MFHLRATTRVQAIEPTNTMRLHQLRSGAAAIILAASCQSPSTTLAAGSSNPTAVVPFKIAVPNSVLRDLKERLAKTRWPDQINGAGWDYGVELGYVKALAEYWRARYDWRKHERALNQFPQFTTEIDGVRIHWTEMPKGGHFAALEQPQLLVEDIRVFFQKVGTRR